MLNEIIKIAEFVLEAFIKMAPFILITVPIAAAVNVFDFSKNIKSYLENRKHTAIIMAALIGSISPLCSCGVIPVITTLLLSGVPLAPVMSFWIASPSMDPEIFFLSVSTLGWDLAVWRLASTFILSLSAGYITSYLTHIKCVSTQVLKDHFISKTEPSEKEDSCGCSSEEELEKAQSSWCDSNQIEPEEDVISANCCKQKETIHVSAPTCCAPTLNYFDPNKPPKESKIFSFFIDDSKKELRAKFKDESLKTILMLVKFLSIAFVLEAIILEYVPEQVIVDFLGKGNSFAILLSSLIGVPLYTSSIAALPMVEGMLAQGMSGGAALAFLVSGPTTTIPALAAVYGIAKRKVFFLYLGFVFSGSLIVGYLYGIIN